MPVPNASSQCNVTVKSEFIEPSSSVMVVSNLRVLQTAYLHVSYCTPPPPVSLSLSLSPWSLLPPVSLSLPCLLLLNFIVLPSLILSIPHSFTPLWDAWLQHWWNGFYVYICWDPPHIFYVHIPYAPSFLFPYLPSAFCKSFNEWRSGKDAEEKPVDQMTLMTSTLWVTKIQPPCTINKVTWLMNAVKTARD